MFAMSQLSAKATDSGAIREKSSQAFDARVLRKRG